MGNKIWNEVKVLGLTLLIIGVAFVGVNYQYFGAQVMYYINRGGSDLEVMETRASNRIYIQSLGLEAPLVYIDEIGEPIFQDALAQGVVHYPGTAAIGHRGNAFFFGHSSDFPTKPGNYKTVFALLPHIEMGDEVVLTDKDGKVYRYQVFDTHVVKPTDTQWLNQETEGKSLLTLQTSYPVGTALQRFLVRAELVK